MLVGISGPDGAGKSTLAAALAERLGSGDRTVVVVHPYGCVFCRRLPDPLRNDPAETDGLPGWLIPPRRALHVVHGLVDALTLVMTVARSHRGLSRHRHPVRLVLADRSALDGLVKFRPRQGALLERLFRRLALGFDRILLLHASPETLALRDGEHPAAILALMSERFEMAAADMPIVVRLDADRSPEEVALAAAAAVTPLVDSAFRAQPLPVTRSSA
ncbi:MAG TPA: hypothetical protein VEY67_05770 [Candidatus Dormibacteraeota bacterium]|nr:hypothetical protein [Candidatus Dormibacteraeota bacterium]